MNNNALRMPGRFEGVPVIRRYRVLVIGPISRRLLPLMLVTVSVAAVGCGGGGSRSTSAPSQPPSTTPPATTGSTSTGGFLGTYTATITGNEHFNVQGANQLSPGTPTTGKWELTLSATSATLTHLPDDFQATDNVAYGHGRITLAASTGCDVNLSPETPGLYRYRLVGGELIFHEVHDSCVDRAAVLTGEAWHRR